MIKFKLLFQNVRNNRIGTIRSTQGIIGICPHPKCGILFWKRRFVWKH